MVQRVTLRTRTSYSTKSNGKRIVKTPGTSLPSTLCFGDPAARGRRGEAGAAVDAVWAIQDARGSLRSLPRRRSALAEASGGRNEAAAG